jgi:hypothetical protein
VGVQRGYSEVEDELATCGCWRTPRGGENVARRRERTRERKSAGVADKPPGSKVQVSGLSSRFAVQAGVGWANMAQGVVIVYD